MTGALPRSKGDLIDLIIRNGGANLRADYERWSLDDLRITARSLLRSRSAVA